MMYQGKFYHINYLIRFLDNHYNPKIHQKSFWPNGLYLTKKSYHYNNEIGLCYFYEKNNVLDRLDIKAKEKRKPLTHFIEYDFMEENNVIITIEHWYFLFLQLN